MTMNKSWYVVAATLALVLLTGSPLAAQAGTTTFELNGTNSGSLAGVYTSPYQGVVGGVATPIICDDFSDESYNPETWTAWVTPLSAVTSGKTTPVLWGQSGYVSGDVSSTTASSWAGKTVSGFSWTLTQAQAYAAAALLSIDILNPSDAAERPDYSYALWALFDTSDPAGVLAGPFAQLINNGNYTTDASNALGYLENAVDEVCGSSCTGGTISTQATSKLSAYNVTIYTYDSGASCGGSPCAKTPPQEFITVTTPEPAAPILLGLNLFGIVGLIFTARRRLVGLTQS